MRLVHTFVVAAALLGDLRVNAKIPNCAYDCFQNAVNDHACDQWLSDVDCCMSGDFLYQIATCLPESCARQPGSEAWDHLKNQCEDAGVRVSGDYEDVLAVPDAPSSTSTSTSEAVVSTAMNSQTTAETSTTNSVIRTTVTVTPPPAEITEPSTTFPTSPSAVASTKPDSQNDKESVRHEGGLSPAAKAALGVVIPLVVIVGAALLWIWYRRRRKEALAEPEAPPAEPKGSLSATHEISGAEIPKQPVELEAAAVSPTEAPEPAALNNTSSEAPRLSLPSAIEDRTAPRSTEPDGL